MFGSLAALQERAAAAADAFCRRFGQGPSRKGRQTVRNVQRSALSATATGPTAGAGPTLDYASSSRTAYNRYGLNTPLDPKLQGCCFFFLKNHPNDHPLIILFGECVPEKVGGSGKMARSYIGCKEKYFLTRPAPGKSKFLSMLVM